MSCISFFSLCAGSWPKKMIISVPVTDVRSKPGNRIIFSYDNLDWEQTTQLLMGERIIAYEESRGWLKIKAKEQRVFSSNKWHDCCGWIKSDHAVQIQEYPENNFIVKIPIANVYSATGNTREKLTSLSLGTTLLGCNLKEGWCKVLLPGGKQGIINKKAIGEIKKKSFVSYCDLSKNIIEIAQKFLGSPYLWGGGSFYNPHMSDPLTSIDCSNFIRLCHKTLGINLPRNSYSQYQDSKKVVSEPKKGDLIFISTSNKPENIKHVMLYAGDDVLIESVGKIAGKSVRKVVKSNGRIRLGKEVSKLKSGEKVREGTVFLGTFLR